MKHDCSMVRLNFVEGIHSVTVRSNSSDGHISRLIYNVCVRARQHVHVWRDQVCYEAYTCRHSDDHWSTSLQCLAIVLYARKAAHKNIHVEHKIQVWHRVNLVTIGYIQGVCLCLSRSDCLLSFYRFSFAAWLVHAPLHASIQRSITLVPGVGMLKVMLAIHQ